MSFVVLKDVVKKYDTNRISVDHLNLTVQQGEVFGLLGPNGAGKSTTIHVMCGLLPFDHGTIHIDGLSVKQSPIEVKKRIGVVPQDLAIYEELTAWDNVVFFAKLYGLKGKELLDRVEESLRFVGLLDRAKDNPKEFSGGMKRRLNIACAITHGPKLIIMDEPTVGIDPQSRNHILESVRELNRRGSTIIYTSHYMEEVSAISDRIGIMDQGHLVAIGTEEELKKRVEHEEKIIITPQYLNEEAIRELKQHTGILNLLRGEDTLELFVKSAQTELQDILFILSKHQVGVRSIACVEPNLETLFLALTGRSLRD